MKIPLKDFITVFDAEAPFCLQESYDNAGLLLGDPVQEVNKALLCVDITEAVIDEAIANHCDLIISHHPLIFKGLKQITTRNLVERSVRRAIKHDIAILAVHTNIDKVSGGVNAILADKLGLEQTAILRPESGHLNKLVCFVPDKHAKDVRNAMFKAGTGHIGNYDACSYNLKGKGSFRPGEDSNPFVGEKAAIHFEDETRIETVVPAYKVQTVIQAMVRAHPYEEVAYDIYPLDNHFAQAGLGMIGTYTTPLGETSFLDTIKETLQIKTLRHSAPRNTPIKKVALCGGSGSDLIHSAIAHNADAFVTSDIKYHDFFEADEKLLLIDAGHYETEQFTKELFYKIIVKNFPNFATQFSKIITNPVNYY